MKRKTKLALYSLIFSVLLLATICGYVWYSGFFVSYPPGIYCRQPKFDFGVIPVKNGVAAARHEFVIENNTDADISIEDAVPSCPACTRVSMKEKIVPKHGQAVVVVDFTLPSSDIIGRTVEIALVKRNNRKDPFFLYISGRSAFSAFSMPKGVYFGEVYSGTEKTGEIDIFLPSNAPAKNFVRDIQITEVVGGKLEAKVIRKNSRSMRDEKIGSFYENKTTIQVALHTERGKVGLGRAKIIVGVSGGGDKEIAIPVSWNVEEKPIFEPHSKRYLLIALQPVETREFQVIYNEDAGGKLKSANVTGNGLEIVSRVQHEKSIYFKLKYTAGAAVVSGVVGTLVIETENGGKQTLEVVADAE
jgi:hypothetical protein